MADQKWADWELVLNHIMRCRININQTISLVEDLEKIKVLIMDDPTRRANMKLLVDLDPEWDMAKLQNWYTKLKNAADWLKSNAV